MRVNQVIMFIIALLCIASMVRSATSLRQATQSNWAATSRSTTGVTTTTSATATNPPILKSVGSIISNNQPIATPGYNNGEYRHNGGASAPIDMNP